MTLNKILVVLPTSFYLLTQFTWIIKVKQTGKGTKLACHLCRFTHNISKRGNTFIISEIPISLQLKVVEK